MELEEAELLVFSATQGFSEDNAYWYFADGGEDKRMYPLLGERCVIKKDEQGKKLIEAIRELFPKVGIVEAPENNQITPEGGVWEVALVGLLDSTETAWLAEIHRRLEKEQSGVMPLQCFLPMQEVVPEIPDSPGTRVEARSDDPGEWILTQNQKRSIRAAFLLDDTEADNKHGYTSINNLVARLIGLFGVSCPDIEPYESRITAAYDHAKQRESEDSDDKFQPLFDVVLEIIAKHGKVQKPGAIALSVRWLTESERKKIQEAFEEVRQEEIADTNMVTSDFIRDLAADDDDEDEEEKPHTHRDTREKAVLSFMDKVAEILYIRRFDLNPHSDAIKGAYDRVVEGPDGSIEALFTEIQGILARIYGAERRRGEAGELGL